MQDFLYWNAKLEEWGTVPDRDLGLRHFKFLAFGLQLWLSLAQLSPSLFAILREDELILHKMCRETNSFKKDRAMFCSVVPVTWHKTSSCGACWQLQD